MHARESQRDVADQLEKRAAAAVVPGYSVEATKTTEVREVSKRYSTQQSCGPPPALEVTNRGGDSNNVQVMAESISPSVVESSPRFKPININVSTFHSKVASQD